MSLWATVTLPKRLNQGDTTFLNNFAFLFFRFRPSAHWFVLVLLLRNMAFAVIPVITNPAVELFAFSVVVLLCVVVSSSLFPWSVHQANYLDIGIHVGLLLIIFLAALQTQYVDEILLGNMLLVVFFTSMSCFLGVGAWCLHLVRLRLKRPFQFFLCHQQRGRRRFLPALEGAPEKRRQVERDVFLDSDNLLDLSILFEIVRARTDTLVVLCTQEILCRPWCVGEMTTSRLHSLDTILLIFPDFRWPTRAFIDDYASHVEGVMSLAPHGISVEMAQDNLAVAVESSTDPASRGNELGWCRRNRWEVDWAQAGSARDGGRTGCAISSEYSTGVWQRKCHAPHHSLRGRGHTVNCGSGVHRGP